MKFWAAILSNINENFKSFFFIQGSVDVNSNRPSVFCICCSCSQQFTTNCKTEPLYLKNNVITYLKKKLMQNFRDFPPHTIGKENHFKIERKIIFCQIAPLSYMAMAKLSLFFILYNWREKIWYSNTFMLRRKPLLTLHISWFPAGYGEGVMFYIYTRKWLRCTVMFYSVSHIIL